MRSSARRPSSGLTEPQKIVRSASREAISAHVSQGDSPSRNRSVSGSGIATSMSVSDSSKTICWRSAGVHSLRNSSADITGCPSGVSVAWKAYRWLANISPGRAVGVLRREIERVRHPVEDERVTDHGCLLQGCGRRGRRPGRRRRPGRAGSGACGGRSRRAGRASTPRPRRSRPRRSRTPGCAPIASVDVGEHAGGERAPARGQQQFDARVPVAYLHRAQQAHVDDGDALLAAARVVDLGQCPHRPLGGLGRRLAMAAAWNRGPTARQGPDFRWRQIRRPCRAPGRGTPGRRPAAASGACPAGRPGEGAVTTPTAPASAPVVTVAARQQTPIAYSPSSTAMPTVRGQLQPAPVDHGARGEVVQRVAGQVVLALERRQLAEDALAERGGVGGVVHARPTGRSGGPGRCRRSRRPRPRRRRSGPGRPRRPVRRAAIPGPAGRARSRGPPSPVRGRRRCGAPARRSRRPAAAASPRGCTCAAGGTSWRGGDRSRGRPPWRGRGRRARRRPP